MAGDNGVHTFTNGVTLKTAGTQSITATDTVTGTITGTQSLTVNPAAATTLTVSGYPSPITAGTANNVTVTAKDGFGNVATGYTGTVRLTSSDARAVLPANYTFTGGDAGTHVFSVTLKTVGTQSITATDTVTGTITGTQSGITVNVGPTVTFTVSGFANPTTAGVAHNVTVTAQDAGGNTTTGYRGTVHFTSSDGQATLPANYTFVAGDNGVHTFTNGATLKTAGTQSITATDTVTGTITGTQSVTVNAGTCRDCVDQYHDKPNPALTCTGTVGNITCTSAGEGNSGRTLVANIELEDLYGNAVTNAGGTVNIALSTTGRGSVIPATLSVPNGASMTSAQFTLTRTSGSGRTVTMTATAGGQTLTVTMSS